MSRVPKLFLRVQVAVVLVLLSVAHAEDVDETTDQPSGRSFPDRHSILSLLESASHDLESNDIEGRRQLATAYAALGQEQSIGLAAANNVALREVAVNLGRYGDLNMARKALGKIDASEFGNYQRFIAYRELSRLFIDHRETKHATVCVDELCKILPLLKDYRSNGYWHSKLAGDVAALCLEVGDGQRAYEIAQSLILRSQREPEREKQLEMLAVACGILVQDGHETEAVAISRAIKSDLDRSEILITMAEGFLACDKYCSALKVIDETNRHRTRARILVMVAERQPADLECDGDLEVLDAAEAEAKACVQEHCGTAIHLLTEIAALHARDGARNEASRIFGDILTVGMDDAQTERSQQVVFAELGKSAVKAAQLGFPGVAKHIFNALTELVERDVRRDLELSVILKYQSDAGLCEDAEKTLREIRNDFIAGNARLQLVKCLGRHGKISTAEITKSITDDTQRELALGVLARVYLADERPSLAIEALTLRYGTIDQLPAFDVFTIA